MWLGIDFGTTNTSAAAFDGDKLEYIPLDPYNENPRNLRSMIYIDRDQRVRIGVEAAQTFLREDTGRPVLLEDKFVGTITNTVAQQFRQPGEPDGPITIIHDVTVQEDVAIRGRLLQSVKTALRSPSYQGTKIFGKFYTTEELIALILGHVRKQAEAHLQQSVQQAVIGRPVTFTYDPQADAQAEAKIRQAAHRAGFTEIAFMTEPLAAANFYVNNSHRDETIFIFDFGGGTLDLTIVRATATGEQTILASQGVLIGGDDLDSAIMRGQVAPYFGTTSSIDTNFDGRPVVFPSNMVDLLEQWQSIPMLTRSQYDEVIQRAIHHGDNRPAFEALHTLATKNYGFALFQAIERAKCTLSDTEEALIALQMEAILLQVPITREELREAITKERSEIRRAIRATLAQANLSADQIDVIVATGGSSAMQTFQALLKHEIPSANLIISDLFGSATGGLAIHAHQQAMT